jgi:hypothetical protein
VGRPKSARPWRQSLGCHAREDAKNAVFSSRSPSATPAGSP